MDLAGAVRRSGAQAPKTSPRDRIPFSAKAPIPVVPDADMPDLVAQDHVKDLACAHIPGTNQLVLHGWRSVEPARFQRAGNDGEASEQVTLCLLGHFPQTVVGRKVAIVETQ